MVLAADYPFLDVLWTMIVFFLWFGWLILLFHVVGDVFRRRDIRGGKKAVWLIFLLLVPFLGVLTYLIVYGDDMARRNEEAVAAARGGMDDYVRSVAGGSGAAGQIERAKGLLDSGAISQAEFDAIKAKALA
jgi:type VI protein secretion system component VasK